MTAIAYQDITIGFAVLLAFATVAVLLVALRATHHHPATVPQGNYFTGGSAYYTGGSQYLGASTRLADVPYQLP